MIFMEYNCGPKKLHEERLIGISRHLINTWPGETLRSYNLPTDMGNEVENEQLTEFYFPDLSLLQEYKNVYDPSNVFDAFQGVKPTV